MGVACILRTTSRVQSLTGILLVIAIFSQTTTALTNILHIQVSDLGWQDVGWKSSDFKTPRLDALRAAGIDLPSFYTGASGIGSRTAVATGKYPYKMGYARSVKQAFANSNYSLSLEHKITPQFLKEKGYKTHLIGNWVLGACSNDHAPWNRGYDTFYGSMGAYLDHYTHENNADLGYDFWLNENVDLSANGSYSTALSTQRVLDILNDHNPKKPFYIYMALEALHKPLEAPAKYLDGSDSVYDCSGISDEERRKRCGMMAAIDYGVGQIMDLLETKYSDKKIFVLFTGITPGPGKLGSSSYPLRGRKGSVYEGGTRVPAFAYSKALFSPTKRVFKGEMHAVDILPTFLRVAHFDEENIPSNLDGVSMLYKFRNSDVQHSRRLNMVYDIDVEGGTGAIRKREWKLVYTRDYGDNCMGWRNYPGKPTKTPCKEWELYNVVDDPSETNDMSDDEEMKFKMKRLKGMYEEFKQQAAPPQVHALVSHHFLEDNDGTFVPNSC